MQEKRTFKQIKHSHHPRMSQTTFTRLMIMKRRLKKAAATEN